MVGFVDYLPLIGNKGVVLRKKFGKKFMSHVMHCEYKRPLQVRQEISIIIRRMKNIVSIFLNEVSGVFLIKRISAGSADQCTPEFGGKRKAGCRQVVVSRDQNTAIHGHVDRKSTRLNSSHVKISYAVFCLKKKK